MFYLSPSLSSFFGFILCPTNDFSSFWIYPPPTNYKDEERCPSNGNCLIDNVIYKATVGKENVDNVNNVYKEKIYVGTTELLLIP